MRTLEAKELLPVITNDSPEFIELYIYKDNIEIPVRFNKHYLSLIDEKDSNRIYFWQLESSSVDYSVLLEPELPPIPEDTIDYRETITITRGQLEDIMEEYVDAESVWASDLWEDFKQKIKET